MSYWKRQVVKVIGKTVADKIFLKVKEGETGQEYIGNKLGQTLVTQMKIVTKNL